MLAEEREIIIGKCFQNVNKAKDGEKKKKHLGIGRTISSFELLYGSYILKIRCLGF